MIQTSTLCYTAEYYDDKGDLIGFERRAQDIANSNYPDMVTAFKGVCKDLAIEVLECQVSGMPPITCHRIAAIRVESKIPPLLKLVHIGKRDEIKEHT